MLKDPDEHYYRLKKMEMDVLQGEISELQLALKPLQGASEFTHLNQRLNNELNCLENEI